MVDLPRVRAALVQLDAAMAQGVRPVPADLVAALVVAEGESMAAPATVALGLRLSAELLARVDAVAAAPARGGTLPAWSRNAVLVAAIEAGLPEVERQAGIDPPTPAADQGDTTAELVAVLRRLLVKLDPPAVPESDPTADLVAALRRKGFREPGEGGNA